MYASYILSSWFSILGIRITEILGERLKIAVNVNVYNNQQHQHSIDLKFHTVTKN